MKMISRRLTPRLSFDKVKGVEEASEDGGVQTKHGTISMSIFSFWLGFVIRFGLG